MFLNAGTIKNADGRGALLTFTAPSTTAVNVDGTQIPAAVVEAYLKASNTGRSDQFGFSVAVSGDTIVVGADSEDSGTTGVNSMPDENASSAGAAYVFVRSGTTWMQEAYLKADNPVSRDDFGNSVGASGDLSLIHI